MRWCASRGVVERFAERGEDLLLILGLSIELTLRQDKDLVYVPTRLGISLDENVR
ncbi:hypothetical protein ACFYO1_26275 [Nocardia sp. NPDC006044]|uniref:hypothetical protein n=1 Tax=Nocardia sp. NPDC006044 TaxID=3364306 RepID=UPI0036B3B72A